MSIIKAFFISISLYSKIPVPGFEWKKEDMQYSFLFFPFVGAVIGCLFVLWSIFCESYSIGPLARSLVFTAIPLVVTGGFHVDGYMDTMDAFHSYKPKEEKLKILSDPHIGAFSVIMLFMYGLLYIAAISQIRDETIYIMAIGFVLSRALSALAAVFVKCAKSDGILFKFSESSKNAKSIVTGGIIVWIVIALVGMLLLDPVLGSLVFEVSILSYIYYIHKCKKELSGITGDTEGFFVCICELCIALVCSLYCILKFGGM